MGNSNSNGRLFLDHALSYQAQSIMKRSLLPAVARSSHQKSPLSNGMRPGKYMRSLMFTVLRNIFTLFLKSALGIYP